MTYKIKYFGNLDPSYTEPPLYYEIQQWGEMLYGRKKSLFYFYDIPKDREIELINCLFDYIREECLIEMYGKDIKTILEYSTIEYEMNGHLCHDITVIHRFGAYVVFRLYEFTDKERNDNDNKYAKTSKLVSSLKNKLREENKSLPKN